MRDDVILGRFVRRVGRRFYGGGFCSFENILFRFSESRVRVKIKLIIFG